VTEIIAKLLSFIIFIPLSTDQRKENNMKESNINNIEELNEDEEIHWTDSIWYVLTVYTLGLCSGIMGTLTYQAFQYIQ